MQKAFSQLRSAQQLTADAILATVVALHGIVQAPTTYHQEPGFRGPIRMAITVRPNLVLHYEISHRGAIVNSLQQDPTDGFGFHSPLSYHLN